MHRIFRKALDDAIGVAEYVITVIVDIRGFSAFSQSCESPDTAIFIKKVYTKLIDSYFNFASFYKSAGDGLLLTIPYVEDNLKEMAEKTVSSCIDCHNEFGSICSGDPMINFAVPDKIGIGIARGNACCLVSGDTTIDYSGRLLNLTARLSSIARPSGIIIDGRFGINLLSKEIRKGFKKRNVYLDGIAEYEPITVYVTEKFTVIPKHNTKQIARETWRRVVEEKRFKNIEKFGGEFRHFLETEATSEKDIRVTVTHKQVENGKVSRDYVKIYEFQDFRYEVRVGRPIVWLDYKKLSERLKKNNVKPNMNIKIEIAYVER